MFYDSVYPMQDMYVAYKVQVYCCINPSCQDWIFFKLYVNFILLITELCKVAF